MNNYGVWFKDNSTLEDIEKFLNEHKLNWYWAITSLPLMWIEMDEDDLLLLKLKFQVVYKKDERSIATLRERHTKK